MPYHCRNTFRHTDYAIRLVCAMALRRRRATQGQRHWIPASIDERVVDNLRRHRGCINTSRTWHSILLYDYRPAVWLSALQTDALRSLTLWT